MERYAEMAKKMGVSSFMDQLLTGTDLPYRVEIMAAPLLAMFKVLQMEMYDVSRILLNIWRCLKPTDSSWVPRRDRVPSFSPDVERHNEGVVWVATPRIHRRVQRAGPPILDTIYGELEEEMTGDIYLAVKQHNDESLKAYLSRFNREQITSPT